MSEKEGTREYLMRFFEKTLRLSLKGVPAITDLRNRVRSRIQNLFTAKNASNNDGEFNIDATEPIPEAPELAQLKADYNKIVDFVKTATDEQRQELKKKKAWIYLERMAEMHWEQVLASLRERNAVNPEKTNLEMVTDMQGGGELIGVDENGNILFKDRGTEPVMFGFDEGGASMMVYDRDEEQMARLMKIANYDETCEFVYGTDQPTAYELFPGNGGGQVKGMMAAVEAVSQTCFVQSSSGEEHRSSWIYFQGRNLSSSSPPWAVYFLVNEKKTRVHTTDHSIRNPNRGAIRLLRIQSKAALSDLLE